MKILEMTCIGCPNGCDITLTAEDGKIIEVSGNKCPKGMEFAENEFFHPMRTFTGSMDVMGSVEGASTVSCRSQKEIPKADMLAVAAAIKKYKIKLPVKVGDVLIENVCGTGVNIVATKNVR